MNFNPKGGRGVAQRRVPDPKGSQALGGLWGDCSTQRGSEEKALWGCIKRGLSSKACSLTLKGVGLRNGPHPTGGPDPGGECCAQRPRGGGHIWIKPPQTSEKAGCEYI